MRALTKISQGLFKQCLLICSLALLSFSALAEGLSATEIQAALNNPGRSDEDKARDAGRKPAQVLEFLGLQKGMTVLDVAASGGWYTEVLALAVGPEGKVYAQNAPAFLQYRDGFYDKAISEKLKLKHLGNAQRLDAEFTDMGIDGKVDLAITALNLHDVYNRSPEAGVGMLKGIYAALKPGGVLGVIDHNGVEGADNARLHRMTMQQAIAAAEQAGFSVDVSNLLRNDTDDHTQGVFGDIRGGTDRFLLKLTKPL